MKTIAIFGTISQAALVRNFQYAHYDDESWRSPIYESFLESQWSDTPCYDYIHSVHSSKWRNDGLFLPDCNADGLYHPTQCNFQNHRKGRYPVSRPTERSTTTTEAPTTTTEESTTNFKWLETTTQFQLDSTSAEATTEFPIFETSTEPVGSTAAETTSSFAKTTTFSNTAAPEKSTTTEEFIQIELFPVLNGNGESAENEVSKIVTLSGPGIFAAPKEEDFVKFSSSNFAVAMMKAPADDAVLVEYSADFEEGSGGF
ncbi:unnamed protein product [Oikopleura dioica]|uniref:Thyroglobulin type-1 domain-containing protein n=1 Tax=Oikopleura dioica TaxID=34765 RepID=E4YCM7_OIKDI|nr:unnamed protein product [Oikopleura dioica]